MSRFERLVLPAAALLLAGGTYAATPTRDYHLGRPAEAAEIAGWDIDVRPDGAGLPPGQGSVAQGEKVFEAHCATCHGSFGDSNEYMALTGGIGSLKTNAPVRTVGSKLNFATTLFDYINRAMPFSQSKSLTPDEVYAAAAYVLNLNDIVPAGFVADRDTLPKVKMPNRDGFFLFPGLMHVRGKPDTHNTACMHDCETAVTVTGQLPPGFVSTLYGDISAEFRGLYTMNERRPAAAASAATTTAAAEPSPHELAERNNCTVCHGIDKAIVGPAYRDVAARYRGDAGAAARLERKVREGGAGNWGSIPMPPQSGPTDAELARLIGWVLAGAPDK